MKLHCFLPLALLLGLVNLSGKVGGSPELMVYQGSATSFQDQWTWALDRLGNREGWIGYEMTMPMPRGYTFLGGGWWRFNIHADGDISIDQRLQGVRVVEGPKRIAVLYFFRHGAFHKVKIVQPELPLNLKEKPLVWLKDQLPSDSFNNLSRYYQQARRRDLACEVIEIMGFHQEDGVTDFLLSLLNNVALNRKIREEALGALSFQKHPQARAAILRTAKSEKDKHVREEGISLLAEMRTPEAFSLLAELAKNEKDVEMRATAVEGLGDFATPEAFAILRSLVEAHVPRDVAAEALEGLAEDESAFPFLEKVARSHRLAEVRYEAVDALSENDPERAAGVLERLVAGERDEDVLGTIIGCYAEIKDVDAGDWLWNLAESHRLPVARCTALQELAEMEDPGYADRFLGIVKTDVDEDVREEALIALGRLGNSGLKLVIKVAKSHPSEETREAAMDVVKDYGFEF